MADNKERSTGEETALQRVNSPEFSEAIKKSPGGKEAIKLTQGDIEKLKKEIEAGKISINLIKSYLDNIDKIDTEYRPYILGSILSGLNKKGISIDVIEKGKITLKAGIQSGRNKLDIATHEETVKYQSLLNNYIDSGKINIADIHNGLLYKTSTLGDYLEEKVDGQKINTTDYVVRLLEKYNIQISNDSGVKLADFKFSNRGQYESLRNGIKQEITDNEGDKEFLLAYFDDIYFNERNGIKENAVSNYKESSQKIETGFFEGLNTLSNDQKYSLGIRNKDDAKELETKLKNDPIKTTLEMITTGGTGGLLLGLLLSLKFGWKGFFAGFLGGSFLAGGGTAFASEILNKGADKIKEKGKNTQDDSPQENTENNHNELFNKYQSIFQGYAGKLDKTKLLENLDSLSKNDKFLSAPASSLDIFETTKDEAELKKIFKDKFGIELTSQNKEYYQILFTNILEARKKSIGEYKDGESMKDYLLRQSKDTSEKETTVLPIVSGVKVEKKQLSESQKNELLTYFGIDTKLSTELINNLNALGLDLFQLLGGYKNIFDTHLSSLDNGIKSKIKQSIKIKVGLINDRILELKAKEREKYGDLQNFRNNRWIVNEQIKNLFEEMNNKILPSAYILSQDTGGTNQEEQNQNYRDKIKKTKEMFGCDLTKNGDFDKDFFSKAGFGEIWDSSKNNWEVFDITTKEDIQLTNSIENDIYGINLLNEKDKEVESDAMLAYLITAGIQVIPYAGAVVSIPAMTIDTFTDKDGTLSMLKTFGIVPEEYRMEKHIRDSVLGGVGLIATVFGIQGAVRGVKIAENSRVLKMIKFDKLENMLQTISKKLGMSAEHTNFVSTQLKKLFNVENKVETPAENISKSKTGILTKLGEKVSGIFETRFISKNIDNLKEGESLEIGGVSFKKVNGNFETTLDGVKKELSKKQLLSFIEKLPVEDVQKYVAGVKEAQVLAKEIGKARKIDGHTVEVLSGGKWKIKSNNGTVLDEMQTKAFVEKNLDKLSKEFKGMSISEGGLKMKQGIISGYEKYGIKTVWDYLGKAGFKDGERSKLFGEGAKPIDALGGIILTPATTIRQLIDAIPARNWEDMFRILISGNKNIKVWGGVEKSKGVGDFFSKLFNDSGLVRASLIGTVITEYDEIIGDKNNGKLDETEDYSFYRYGGIINTLILKAFGK